MQSNSNVKVLLPRADEPSPGGLERGFTIQDVIPDDPTLEQIVDLDSLLDSGGLKEPQVAGIIVLSLDGTVRLAASGPGRGFKVTRLRKAQFKDSLDPRKTPEPYRVRDFKPLPSVAFAEGSDCTCLHQGVEVNICK